MSLIEYTLDGKINKVDKAIERIRAYEPLANGFNDQPYYVGYSGGKDSDALRILMQLAGVPHELHHNHTTVDAPETVYYIQSIPNIVIHKPKKSMWQLIVEKKLPPMRNKRYCCSELKEYGGQGRFCSFGVRWDESNNRARDRGIAENGIRDKSKRIIIKNNDNDEARRLFEHCIPQSKMALNPIVDWLDEDVWELLNYYGCESNPLYQCGYNRVGCIGCPMASKGRYKEFADYPKYENLYINAYDRMLKANSHIKYSWKSGEEVFNWWMQDKPLPKQLEGQLSLLDMGA